MGNMYQKRKGRSWDLRKQSIELWPQWITFLQKFNYELNIEKPLIQLTSNKEKFKKLEKFVYENNDINLRILKKIGINPDEMIEIGVQCSLEQLLEHG